MNFDGRGKNCTKSSYTETHSKVGFCPTVETNELSELPRGRDADVKVVRVVVAEAEARGEAPNNQLKPIEIF
jgi:hypothetical protein